MPSGVLKRGRGSASRTFSILNQLNAAFKTTNLKEARDALDAQPRRSLVELAVHYGVVITPKEIDHLKDWLERGSHLKQFQPIAPAIRAGLIDALEASLASNPPRPLHASWLDVAGFNRFEVITNPDNPEWVELFFLAPPEAARDLRRAPAERRAAARKAAATRKR